MKQSFLTVKLYELEQQFGKLQAGIRICQKENIGEIQREIEKIQAECKEEDMILQQSVGNVCSEAVSALADAQLCYDKKVEEIVRNVLPESLSGVGSLKEKRADIDTIYAEYSIDFAIRASKNALRAALQAVESEMESEEWREKL